MTVTSPVQRLMADLRLANGRYILREKFGLDVCPACRRDVALCEDPDRGALIYILSKRFLTDELQFPVSESESTTGKDCRLDWKYGDHSRGLMPGVCEACDEYIKAGVA